MRQDGLDSNAVLQGNAWEMMEKDVSGSCWSPADTCANPRMARLEWGSGAAQESTTHSPKPRDVSSVDYP